MYVSISIVRAIADELRREGVSLATFYERCELTAGDLAETTGRVSVDQYDRIVAAARALSCTPALGLRVGASAPPAALHIVGYILATCATIREAFTQFSHYSPLIKEGASWQLVERGEHAHFLYAHDLLAPETRRFDAEECLAFVLNLGRQFIGDENAPTLVRFRHAAPAYLDDYARAFRCEARFDQPVNEMVFPARYMEMEQLHRDERLRALLNERAEVLLAQRRSKGALVDQVRDLLRAESDGGRPHLTQLAARLGLTLRSLERRVREHGVSLATLTEEARREVACAALRRPHSSIKDVAYRLGFSEPSAFHRAFKRWTGMTPTHFREAQEGPRRVAARR